MLALLSARFTSRMPRSALVAGVVGDGSAPCRCGHDLGHHDHWRSGTDCVACGCGRYRSARRGARQSF